MCIKLKIRLWEDSLPSKPGFKLHSAIIVNRMPVSENSLVNFIVEIKICCFSAFEFEKIKDGSSKNTKTISFLILLR